MPCSKQRAHYKAKIGGTLVNVLVDSNAGKHVVSVSAAGAVDASTNVVEGQTKNGVMKLTATFKSGKKRVFLAPSTNTLVLVTSEVASDAALKPPFALVKKPAPPQRLPKPLDAVVMAVQNYFSAAAVSGVADY